MIQRIAVAAIALTLLAGCSAPAPAPTAKPITSTLTCQQFGQAASVVFVAVTGNAQGTVSDEKLATELDRGKALMEAIEVEPGTDLADLVADLEPVSSADVATEWEAHFEAFEQACLAEGDELVLTAPGG